MADDAHLRDLNAQNLTAYMTADIDWYASHLLEEFTFRKPDGTLLDKAAFLRRTAEGPDVAEYRLERVRVRVRGDLALVDGTATYTLPDGRTGTSRYTDGYRRVGGDWKVLSAELERVHHSHQER
jgi:ketosteroid isomerase-like protein